MRGVMRGVMCGVYNASWYNMYYYVLLNGSEITTLTQLIIYDAMLLGCGCTLSMKCI